MSQICYYKDIILLFLGKPTGCLHYSYKLTTISYVLPDYNNITRIITCKWTRRGQNVDKM